MVVGLILCCEISFPPYANLAVSGKKSFMCVKKKEKKKIKVISNKIVNHVSYSRQNCD